MGLPQPVWAPNPRLPEAWCRAPPGPGSRPISAVGAACAGPGVGGQAQPSGHLLRRCGWDTSGTPTWTPLPPTARRPSGSVPASRPLSDPSPTPTPTSPPGAVPSSLSSLLSSSRPRGSPPTGVYGPRGNLTAPQNEVPCPTGTRGKPWGKNELEGQGLGLSTGLSARGCWTPDRALSAGWSAAPRGTSAPGLLEPATVAPQGTPRHPETPHPRWPWAG